MALESSKAELVIGIAARIGVDTKLVVSAIRKILREYNYESVEVKATAAILEIDKFSTIETSKTKEKYHNLIDACDKIREATGENDIMAKFAISKIVGERAARGDGTPFARVAYIVNQLKRPEEGDLLRSLYGEHYVQIGCHARYGVRAGRLAQLISNDNPRRPKGADWSIDARDLMRKDEVEEENKWGQRLRDVFPSSDVIVEAESEKEILSSIDRFLRAVFGDPRVTPTPQEYGMQLARTASLRSSDLSRQVGAAILNQWHEVQALGCNEVPRAGGGTYWEGDVGDQREFQLGKDSNDERKREVLRDIVERLREVGVIRSDVNDQSVIDDMIFSRSDKIISDSQLMDSLEYGRTIHAEMNAITDAARGGHSVRGCVLYCNTFPCHNCAKHIVASGISRVVYNMPYPKSYAEDLFSDSVCVDPDEPAPGKVTFTPFIGIAGPMFGRVFEKRKWKSSDGTVPRFSKFNANFVRRTPAPAYTEAEVIILQALQADLQRAGFSVVRPVGS
ncbi:anti-phage dCTP deaminase [Caulobacter sp. LjRoot300]|uniref:anti-phage dCTP deaminase n=1 Tax=Caulobacter sp. LjRoot300 TaxID=3342321 RepID=UPI003ED06528